MKYYSFVKNWLISSLATFCFSYLMWGFMDIDVFLKDGINGWDVCFDLMYCSIFTMFSLFISNLLIRIFVGNRLNRFRLSIHIVLLLIANYTWTIAFENMFNKFWHEGNDIYWDRLAVFGMVATLLTMMNACMYHSSIIIRKEKENVELYNNLLRLQTNPHFILNSINTLAELIHENPIQAENYTIKFSEIYRYVVNYMDEKNVPIHEEIHFVKNYCELQEINSPHTVCVDISEELTKCKDRTLPLAIQMIVENAIKHNCHTKEKPLSIGIYRQDNYIVVRNVLNPIKSSFPTTQKGLENLDKRYNQLGKKLIITNDNKYFEVKIPIL